MGRLVTIRWWLLLALAVMSLAACGGEGLAISPLQSPPVDEVTKAPSGSEKEPGATELGTPVGTRPEVTATAFLEEVPGSTSIPPLPELEGNTPFALTEEVQLGWQLRLTLPWSELALGVKAECPEPPLDSFTPGCSAPVPPPFPASGALPKAYLYYPDNPSFTLQRLFLSILPPAPVRLWQVVLTYAGDEPMSLSWDFSWEGEEAGQAFSLRLIDAEGFIDMGTPGSLALPTGVGRQTAGFVICSEMVANSVACPQRWP